MKRLRNVWLHRALGLALGAVFLYAAKDKLIDPRPLVTIIWGYQLLPNGPINLIAIFMPWMELLVGLTLLTGVKRRAGAFWATLMLTGFIVALGINAARGLNVACGCFSTSATDTQNAWLLVLRDLPMWLAAAVMLLFPPPERPRAETRESSPGT
ncbi:MAG TPA: MauE/DoxX family redox-associated membrane protein [Thermoanaerobaculaceae bacterium]|nr:MauE/DoxX family redox-associated membrane protein [Thermoanaerobaculaceae bacterium]HRS16777.1 MauE/DoxX family redox-associated membrane protein [Thermoanaerobaculaceae bacterium]